MKKNLILNSVNALKNLKVEQVKQKFQDNNYTLNENLDKLILAKINDTRLKNNTDEIYKHVIEELPLPSPPITSPITTPTTQSPTTPLSLSNSLSSQLSKSLSISLSKSPTTPPTTTTPPPSPPSPPPQSPPSPTTPTTPSPTDEPKNDNFMNLLHLLSSRM